VGGIGWVAGTLYGGLLQVDSIISYLLNELGNGISQYIPLAGGVLLLLVLLTAPDGLAFQAWQQNGVIRRVLQVPRRALPLPVVPDAVPQRVVPRRLIVDKAVVRFGGVVALSEVSLEVGPGEIVGLIGPNGAGKTTLIDMVTGYVRSSGGGASLDTRPIAGLTPAQVARSGLSRSFQSVELFEDMTIIDNLRAASEQRDLSAYVTDLFWPRTKALSPTACAAIREFDLELSLNKLPSELPYGKRRLVGIARAVATDASILLLDEPAAGLDDYETAELGRLIQRLAREWGMGVLLIEHDVELVMRLCHRVHVLNFGRELAAGPADEIRRNPAVMEAYLGGEVEPVIVPESISGGER
jgi:ABC-type branched-subunit amino acid transport system ATPase component